MRSASESTFAWSPQKYIEVVENSTNPLLREYQRQEINYLISGIDSPNTKTFVDLGAGYGRVLNQLAKVAKSVVAVEIDSEMINELKKRAEKLENVKVIEGDANELLRLVGDIEIKKPVLLSLQNSIGPWVGDYKVMLAQMREFARQRQGEVIISLFCAEGLKEYGIEMYKSAEGLVGEIDFEASDFERGIFRSKSGYLSQWLRKDQRKEMKKLLGGEVVAEVKTHPAFYILHIKY